MAIPQQLAVELAAASSSIGQDGELRAISRMNILRLIEALSSTEHASAGYLRRARLAIVCAHEVFERIKPYSNVLADARTMLEKDVMAISGKYDLSRLQKECGDFHTTVIGLFEHGETAFVSAYAGMAVFAAINTILYDTNFDLVGENEKNVPPDDWDVSYYGSLAASGSAIWELKGGEENRRAYWQWYLGEAIPRGWDVLVPLEVK
ncbi:Imm5 family immunity protein [Trinickia sp. YCB016]